MSEARPGGRDAPDDGGTYLEEALQRAQRAAAEGDPAGLAFALYEARVMDGLVRRLQAAWPRLEGADIADAVSTAVTKLYAAIRTGNVVRYPVAWLYKVSSRAAFDRDAERNNEESLDVVAGRAATVPTSEPVDGDAQDERQVRTLNKLRSLAERLGPTQRAVMLYVIEAVGAGIEHLPAVDVATALGYSVGAVEVALSRGRDRLFRMAHEEGLVRPKYQLLSSTDDEVVEEPSKGDPGEPGE